MSKVALLILVALLMVSCGKKSIPNLEYMPDMYRQISMKAQEWDPHSPNGVGMKTPPAGTVPINFEPYTIGLLDTNAANALQNPLTGTNEVLEAGRKYYNTFCVVCHGVTGDGRGLYRSEVHDAAFAVKREAFGVAGWSYLSHGLNGSGFDAQLSSANSIRQALGDYSLCSRTSARRTSAAAGQSGDGDRPFQFHG